jgi:Asp-tRNA(Asn)/Glu-tRNA(Gln) amidotransferase A subunit family amidase
LGGLAVNSRNGLLKGGKTGPAIVPGKPEESLLIQAVAHTNDKMKMPLGAPRMPDAEIAILTSWIKDGAFWYLSVACEIEAVQRTSPATVVGVDLGVAKHVATSDGQTLDFLPAPTRQKLTARMTKAQREVSRAKRGSNRRRKAVARLQRAHAQIALLRLAPPRPVLAAADPWAIRALVLLGLAASLVIAGPSAPLLLSRALHPDATPAAPSRAPVLQAWITPPSYTGLAPVFLRPDSASISVPAGFAPEGPCKGLPMGLQLIGKPQGDFELLQWAFAYEQANLSMIQQRPPGV